MILPFVAIATILHCARADFVYDRFDVSAGLQLNGAATLRECGIVDHDEDPQLREHGNTAALDIFTTTASNSSNTTSYTDGCGRALQLTPPYPSKAGSAYYQSKVPVLTGFETTFTWKITDQSVECTSIVDKAFSTQHDESCVTVGGDGFAFVVHADPQLGKDALGGDGQDLGYGGIVNSIAIEFDTWTNTQPGSDDVFQDHIAIHAAGPLLPNSSTEATALGSWRPHDIADGKTHRAKIQYLPYVEERYFELMTASENLFPYLREGGGRGIGTLAVFVDQGIVEDRPLFAIPINLGVVLDIPDSLAFVGFTGSTGRKWQRHEIIRWEWYESTA
ncbi:hypothetical protein THAOC_02351 [Thalassiosira oceanica]|uniref:Legume lectin domain-containing protein n=1 Tax=Thalassiosira oceanica TaxID=159749 RepID=K0TES1_THAOC|nr:hypothetical protein THAOC_02351 [Thalassiosira oceanica]|eukprot:EJK75910.1 hypothetical protein THAOC_02351 [Thalassiosira oceanica]